MGRVAGADDTAPPARKSRWLATFYLCIPVGYASGYILGGLIAPALGWRAAFLLEAAAMVPFAAFCAVGPSLDLKGKQPRTGNLHCCSCLALCKDAAFMSCSYCAVTAVACLSDACYMPCCMPDEHACHKQVTGLLCANHLSSRLQLKLSNPSRCSALTLTVHALLPSYNISHSNAVLNSPVLLLSPSCMGNLSE